MIPLKTIRDLGHIFRDTFNQWLEREPFRNSAVISFYTIFSLPGLLVIIINLAGYFYGEEAVTRRISAEIEGMIGANTAKDVESIIANASVNKDFTFSSLMGIATLIFGATGVFYQLQQTLNQIWEVQPQTERKIVKMVLDRVFSFGLILAVGFILLVSLLLSTVLSLLGDWVSLYLSEVFNIVFRFLDFSLSLAVITFLFAAIFKFLPDAKIPWKDVWIGAFVTALLFVLAKFALGFYFGHSSPASAYGAAGSIILIMLWVSYAGLILLFGAEFTRIYANRCGEHIQPSEFAISTQQTSKEKIDMTHSTGNTQSNINTGSTDAPKEFHQAPVTDHIYPLKQDLVMDAKATQATIPDNESVSGEEDPGVGLEFLVTNNKPEK